MFARLLGLSGEVGCRGLLVHAESTEARNFYLHLVPEFEPSPTDDIHLLPLMKDIRRTVDGGYGTGTHHDLTRAGDRPVVGLRVVARVDLVGD